MSLNVNEAAKKLRELRKDAKYEEGVKYYLSINGDGVDSVELAYEYLSCLYFWNKPFEASVAAQRVLSFNNLAPHQYVLSVKALNRTYRYDLIKEVEKNLPESTMGELGVIIDGAATVASFLASQDDLLRNNGVSAKAFLSTESLIEHLKNSIQSRTPTSFIRLGDGEGCVIASLLHDGLAADAWGHHFFNLQFGRDFIESAQYGAWRAEITRLLVEAINDADVIGVLKEKQVRRLQETYAPPIQVAGNYYNYLYLTEHEVQASLLVDSCVHHEMIFVDFIRDILLMDGIPLGIVGPHIRVAEAIRERGSVDFVFHQTPAESKYFSDSSKNHYPFAFEKIVDSLKEDASGRTYLVGAGILGKVYCDVIKKAGGVAIDIGSLMDLFAGHLHTRTPFGKLNNASDFLIDESFGRNKK